MWSRSISAACSDHKMVEMEQQQTIGFGMAPLLFFVLILLLQFTLRKFAPAARKKKRMSAKESELVLQIKQLNREADALSTPATFAKSSKVRRAAAAKEKELALLKQSSGGDYSWLARQLSVSFVVKVIVIALLGGWFRHTAVVVVPASLLQPFGGMLSSKGNESGVVKVSVMPWLLLSTHVASYLVNNVWQQRQD